MYNQKPLSGDLLDYGNPLSDGLVGCWLFNEGSGNKVFDLSGNGNDGVFAATHPNWCAGNLDSALNWDNNNEDVVVSDSPTLKGMSGLTFVFSINNTDDGATHRLIGKANTYDVQIRHDLTPSKCYVSVWDEGANKQTGLIPNFDWATYSGQYVHIAITTDGTTAKLYANSVLIGSVAQPFVTVNTADISSLYLGGNSSYSCNGKLEYFYMYNRALTVSEIAPLYQKLFCMVKTRKRRIIVPEVGVAAVYHGRGIYRGVMRGMVA